MKANNIEIRFLPKLSVIRATFCSQKMTDELIQAYLEKGPQKPLYEDFENEDERWENDLNQAPISELIGYIISGVCGDTKLPDTDMGLIDLALEFRRRNRKLKGLKDIEIKGNDFALSYNGPFPKIEHLDSIPLRSEELKKGLNQEFVDKLVTELYVRHPEWFYEVSEMLRRNLRLWNIYNKFRFEAQLISEKHFSQKLEVLMFTNIYEEILIRVGAYCEISFFKLLKANRNRYMLRL